jgi:purine-nucleoside phosphorylase
MINIPGLRSHQQARFSNVQVLTLTTISETISEQKQEQEEKKRKNSFSID